MLLRLRPTLPRAAPRLGLQRPTPRQITLLPVSPFFTCSPPVPPTKPVNDPRDEPPGDSLGSYPVPPRGSFTAKFLPSRILLSDIPITATEPAGCRSSFGFLHGVEESDGDLTNLKFTMRLVSTVPGREDHLVWLRLASSQPPNNVILFGLQLLVRQPSPRPLQCRPSGRIGQVSEICPRVGACVSCGHQHQAAAICRL
ncbi:hypothetical protein HPB51_025364 [Rhipicephalus microplus]|uniref:Uncharacterized protein n=1 Tax=Rhipicephalus microplus TaxID=6941 RepID=A0A9J6E4U2_RHIMP|nr:hypothetical protein HPB51_025364 [Rhipicephalus microplus]